MKYLSNKSIVGTHFYKVFNDGNVLHVNHMENGLYLINMIEDYTFDIMEHPENYDIFDFKPEKPTEISEEEFTVALRKAIFELGLFEYVKSK